MTEIHLEALFYKDETYFEKAMYILNQQDRMSSFKSENIIQLVVEEVLSTRRIWYAVAAL